MSHLFVILAITTLYALAMRGDKKGCVFFIAGLILHFLYITVRWVSLGHIPITDRYDILGIMAFLSALGFIYLHYIKRIKRIMDFFPLLPVLLCLLAVFQERVDTINPAMSSSWFYLYMALFIAGFVLKGVGTVLGVMYLKESETMLEILQYRFTLAGWMFFSFALIAGSVWFYLAYGVYWLWTAKELWTTIVWFYYGFYLHARLVNSLKGWLAAEIGAAGFVVLLFSYLGVTPILGSPWTQF